MITIVNYGLGNILAFVNIYKRLNIPITVATTADELVRANKIILPGVGAFDWAMKCLNESGMRNCLDDLVLRQKRLVLGVCVGMQMMARHSEEGELMGLGWIDAEVKKFDESIFTQKTHLPHMGWNDIKVVRENGLFQELEHGARFYFLHSYYISCQKSDDVIAVAEYGGEFACTVNSGNVYGVQFHPEKSHQWGIQLLENFAKV
ncbi:MAG TPA: imidazole glycerol phosphate synthase subunit HisH [Nitrospirae bacterium]|nr:imidazole glycerol phosphate synthase subunit HisH [Nitrospirota bacterium]